MKINQLKIDTLPVIIDLVQFLQLKNMEKETTSSCVVKSEDCDGCKTEQCSKGSEVKIN